MLIAWFDVVKHDKFTQSRPANELVVVRPTITMSRKGSSDPSTAAMHSDPNTNKKNVFTVHRSITEVGLIVETQEYVRFEP
jgi:hypothetical protein